MNVNDPAGPAPNIRTRRSPVWLWLSILAPMVAAPSWLFVAWLNSGAGDFQPNDGSEILIALIASAAAVGCSVGWLASEREA